MSKAFITISLCVLVVLVSVVSVDATATATTRRATSLQEAAGVSDSIETLSKFVSTLITRVKEGTDSDDEKV
jgi:hypothetical protein